MKRILITIAAMLTAACTPPAATTTPEAATAVPAPDATTEALLNALTPLVSTEVGQPVSLQTTTVTVRDEWAYVVAEPRKADGSAIDWTATNLASRFEHGAMDTNGSVHALLKNQNGAWTLLEHVIAPTDVAWSDWPERHGVPADVLGVPAN